MIGKTLAHYEITALLGKGGMGEVYRATDGKLGRDVALKVLPAELARDPDRMARFRREAQLLASLSHPNIGAIFGLEDFDGTFALVLELVEGPTLADRLVRGPLPLDEALPIAVQIADAIEAAHDKGIIHRDLKPANVKLGAGDRVKVLDFGLAKAILGDADGGSSSGSGGALADSPTITPTYAHSLTGAHVILGTAAYMSPEQARRKPVDRRTDIWAFGAVLWEMVTGAPPFPGETVTDVLAAVVRAEPEWDRLPPDTPTAVRRVLERCLRKDPARRLRHVADARLELEEARDPSGLADSAAAAAAPAPRSARLRLAAAVLLGAALGAAGLAGLRGLEPKAPPAPVRHLRVDLPDLAPEQFVFGLPVAVAPDGGTLAFMDGARHLVTRDLRSGDSAPVPGIELRPTSPVFFSPDSKWIGYTFGGFRKVALRGGVPIDLGDLPSYLQGVSWGADGWIYYSRYAGEEWMPTIYRMSEGGGNGEPVPIEATEDSVWQAMSWPHALPGGRGLLVTAFRGGVAFPSAEGTRIEAVSLETGKRTTVLKGGSWPWYVSTGHVLALDEANNLIAVPFSVKDLAPTGPPQLVLEGVSRPYAVTDDGTLFYTPVHEKAGDRNRVVWVSRDGSVEPVGIPPAHYSTARISPDGRRVALRRQDHGSLQLWTWDLERRSLSSVTRGPGIVGAARWSPDGRTLAYAGGFADGEKSGVFTVPADGTESPHRVATGVLIRFGDWTPDGKRLVFGHAPGYQGGDENWDLWLADRDGESEPERLTETPDFSEIYPRVSPDGKWVAYIANPDGRSEVWVAPFARKGAPVQVSGAGRTDGDTARGELSFDLAWSPDSRTLYYMEGARMMSASIGAGDAPNPGTPVVVFERKDLSTDFDLSPDGRRFLMIEQSEGEPVRSMEVFQGFAGTLGSHSEKRP